tara:strand:+ start:291 stop:524 length:234 start_codon:yes stop_codon:yes gene_type:complete
MNTQTIPTSENTPQGRRKRAAVLRRQKEEERLLNEMQSNTTDEAAKPLHETDRQETQKIKRTRMQNSKGTSGMFIKP